MKNKYWLGLGVIVVLGIAGFGGWYVFFRSVGISKSYQTKKSVWQTEAPVLANDFSSIKIIGTVKSNGFAMVSPRRAGIIQDVFFDIGDQVAKGDTMAILFPEGVEGQSSAAMAEANARLQKARAELEQVQGVVTDAVAVATKQWRETGAQLNTRATLDTESQRQLEAKKSEGVLVATQAWENLKIILFGTGSNTLSRSIVGSFADSIQKTKLKNLADDIQRMEQSGAWGTDSIVDHLGHLESFLQEAEKLYKNVKLGGELSAGQIASNIAVIQSHQLKVSQVKQSILALEEKTKKLAAEEDEKTASVDRSLDMIDLVQSQQNLSLTQAEKNVELALANYNTALVKSGHQKITAPFSGIITARMVEVGESVMTNKPIFYLEGVDTDRSEQAGYEVHFSVPESWQKKIKIGDSIDIATVDTHQTFVGKIFRLSEQLSLTNGTLMATAIMLPLPHEDSDRTLPDFMHGQRLFVYLKDSASQIFSVPSLALKKRGTDYFLWKKNPPRSPLVKGEEIEQILVEVLAEDGEFSQIFTTDLSLEDLIITNPSVSLFNQ